MDKKKRKSGACQFRRRTSVVNQCGFSATRFFRRSAREACARDLGRVATRGARWRTTARAPRGGGRGPARKRARGDRRRNRDGRESSKMPQASRARRDDSAPRRATHPRGRRRGGASRSRGCHLARRARGPPPGQRARQPRYVPRPFRDNLDTRVPRHGTGALSQETPAWSLPPRGLLVSRIGTFLALFAGAVAIFRGGSFAAAKTPRHRVRPIDPPPRPFTLNRALTF